jgi:hypothetical protein
MSRLRFNDKKLMLLGVEQKKSLTPVESEDSRLLKNCSAR